VLSELAREHAADKPLSTSSLLFPIPRGVGVLLNYILPSYIISILLVLLMSLLITQSLGKVG
jgi:hypothetical protein